MVEEVSLEFRLRKLMKQEIIFQMKQKIMINE